MLYTWEGVPDVMETVGAEPAASKAQAAGE